MSSQRELKYHKERVHERRKPWLCIHCGHAAFSNSSLKLHMRAHTGDKPYSCKECKYRTSDHNSLRRHMLRHFGEKPYRCPYCPYSAIQSSGYKVLIIYLKLVVEKNKCRDFQNGNINSLTYFFVRDFFNTLTSNFKKVLKNRYKFRIL